MSETGETAAVDLLGVVASALDDLNADALDAPLPDFASAATDRERELLGALRDVIVSRRRAAIKLTHLAEAIASEVAEVRERVAVAAGANADVAESAEVCLGAAERLNESARGINVRAGELHRLSESAAEAIAEVAESGQQVTRDSELLSTAISDVATSAGAIASSVRDVDRSVKALAGEISKTSNAVGSIDASIREIDAGAAQTSALTEEMAIAAARGRDVVRETAASAESIAAAVSGVQRSLDRLEQRSDDVSEITKSIQGVAAQAKLLALNASIQAAHAGEAGRGFAVVAREIKQLSDSTTASTREIEAVVRAIRAEVAVAVREAGESGDRARDGLALAQAAASSLEAIAREVELIRQRVLQISGATSSQATETAIVNRAMARLSDLAHRLGGTSVDRHEANRRVAERAREIGALAERVRGAMGEQERASLGMVPLIDGLNHVAEMLESAALDQSRATEGLASSVAEISRASRASNASSASVAFTAGVVDRQVHDLLDEARRVRLPAPARGGSITVPLAARGRAFTFDPIAGYSEAHVNILDSLFERLVASGEGGRLSPSLAAKWDVSADGLRYTFELRPGALFHHGREVAADDVKFSFERLARETEISPFILSSVVGYRAYRDGEADELDGVRVLDERTVRVELTEPIAFFLDLVALTDSSIVPADLVRADPNVLAASPVGSGPFRFVEADESSARLARFADYRDPDVPRVDELRYALDVTPDESLDGVLAGEYAYTRYIPRERLADVLGSAELRSRVQWFTLPQCVYLLMNSDAGRLEDARARRAVAHAIDRRRLVDRYNTAPVADAAEGMIPPSCPGHDPAFEGPAYDPELAIRLLDASGYDRARPLDFVVTEASWSLGSEAVESAVEDLARVGLRARVRRVSHSNAARLERSFDLVEANWLGDYLDPDTFTFGAFHSAFGSFHGLHDSGELDALMQRARSTTDPERRATLYRDVQLLFQEICPALVLLHRREFVIHAAGVEGVQLYPQLPPVRPRDIWVAAAGRAAPAGETRRSSS